MKTYVQYGCGNEAVEGWINYDASPTLRIQKIPIIGSFLRSRLNVIFDDDIIYGDIVAGLPHKDESVDAIFCSHVLEHLSLSDFHVALINTHRILKRGGVFRCIVPDLELDINDYMRSIGSSLPEMRAMASVNLLHNSRLGQKSRGCSVVSKLHEMYGNSGHRWMWDQYSLPYALEEHGFEEPQIFHKGNSDDQMLLRPERDHQFERGIGFQCQKL